jgi:hypothetical protein
MRTIRLFCLLLSGLCPLWAQPGVQVDWVAGVPVQARDLAIQGNLAWVALGDGGVAALDLGLPGQPLLEPAWAPAGYGACHTLALQGGIRWQVESSHLRSIGQDEQGAPDLLGHWQGPGTLGGLLVLDTRRLLVSAAAHGVYILDTDDPGSPVQVSHIPTLGTVEGMALAGSVLCLAEGFAGLRFIDLADPGAPQELGSLDNLAFAAGLAVRDNRVYLADDTGGLRIIDIQDPSQPVELGRADTPGWATGVAVSGDYAFVADRFEGLRVIDISNPAQPVETGHYPVTGSAHTVDLLGELILLGGPAMELLILEHSPPGRPGPGGTGEARGLRVACAIPQSLQPKHHFRVQPVPAHGC